MLRALLDTNTLFDAAFPGRPQHEDAKAILELGRRGLLQLGCGADSICVLYFSASGKATAQGPFDVYLEGLLNGLEIVPLDAALIRRALSAGEPDLDDGIVHASFDQWGADVLVTRDAGAFNGLGRRKTDPAGFMAAWNDGRPQ